MIAKIARKLNQLASNYAIGNFQANRKIIKQLKRQAGSDLFSASTIFDDREYAFHHGGRTEIQYNIGLYGSNSFRYGLAFSLEPGRILFDPLETILPKIRLFNTFIRKNRNRFLDIRRYHWSPENEWESNKVIGEIPIKSVDVKHFIFIGKIMRLKSKFSKSDYHKILSIFDRLYEIYLFVESRNTSKNSLPIEVQRTNRDKTTELKKAYDIKRIKQDSEIEAQEGQMLFKESRFRMRNMQIIQYKKVNSDYTCEVCGYKYVNSYGKLGEDFIVAHHVNPIGQRKNNETTTLADIVLVCANCHAMLHRKTPPLSIRQLRNTLHL